MLYFYKKVTCFLTNQLIKGCTNWGLKGYSISLRCIILFPYLITPIGIHHLFQDSFQLSIWYLHLPTSLWMIRGCNLISDSIIGQLILKLLVVKVFASITYDCLRCPKPCKYILPQELHKHFGIICKGSYCLYLFGHIINSHQNKLVTE